MATVPPAKQSRELATAIYDDWKRKVVDEAKKRAVGQNVDYDTFKNMVAVAHLRPLQAANTAKNDRMLPSWQYSADGSVPSSDQTNAASSALALMQGEPSEPASSSGEFYREWRRNCPSPEAKYRYLRLNGDQGLAALFKIEISSEVLKDILEVLEACWQVQAGAAEDAASGAALKEAAFVIQVLQALTLTGRFSLTLKLMGSLMKKVLQSLFMQVELAVHAARGSSNDGNHDTDGLGLDIWEAVKLAYGQE